MKIFKGSLVIATILSAGAFSGFAQAVSTPGLPAERVSTTARGIVPSDLSASASEVIKLHQNGIGTDIITAYIKSCTSRFQLNATQIIYLQNLGVPSEVISGMMQRDSQLRAASAPVVAPTRTVQSPARVTQQATMVNPPAPATYPTTYVYPYPYYPYYPYYSYYPYYPGFCGSSINLGFAFRF